MSATLNTLTRAATHPRIVRELSRRTIANIHTAHNGVIEGVQRIILGFRLSGQLIRYGFIMNSGTLFVIMGPGAGFSVVLPICGGGAGNRCPSKYSTPGSTEDDLRHSLWESPL